MELLRCFFYVDQFKTVPSKRTVINSALGIIFLFLATLNMAGMPLGTSLWFSTENAPHIDTMIIFTLSGWGLATIWRIVNQSEGFQRSKFILFSLLSIGGLYMLAPLLFVIEVSFLMLIMFFLRISWFIHAFI
ncbi:MAG: hypothetical protein E7204_04900 [Veillonella sp.]|uniref:hypothetical protein n=1 Tax=Veillonella sp. TaxID=1926307 RepID=UPI0025F90461|nr:hypothetical protein [Veillonella sp.]MBE6080166.1 hypothetical protein [Veillonella sp.]